MYQICISGAAHGKSTKDGKELAIEVGKVLAKSGHALLTGATVGLPNYAAEAYKAAGGVMSIGLSPAASKVEHVLKYHLPTKPFHSIIYTGLKYTGRDMLLVNSSDAVICVGGRLGTLHEFVVAVEHEKPVGILNGGGGTTELIPYILKAAGKEEGQNIILSDDPQELLKKLIAALNKRRENYIDLYK